MNRWPLERIDCVKHILLSLLISEVCSEEECGIVEKETNKPHRIYIGSRMDEEEV